MGRRFIWFPPERNDLSRFDDARQWNGARRVRSGERFQRNSGNFRLPYIRISAVRWYLNGTYHVLLDNAMHLIAWGVPLSLIVRRCYHVMSMARRSHFHGKREVLAQALFWSGATFLFGQL